MRTDMPIYPTPKPAGGEGAPKSFLVIGGNGFIGRAVVRNLLSRDVGEIISASRSALATQDSANRQPRWTRCDIMDAASINAACAGIDCVINCYRDDVDEAASAIAIKNLLDACEANGVQRLIYLSSAAIYGGATGIVNEWTPFAAPINWYGRAKSCAERACSTNASEKFRIAILRPTLVYGPDGEEWFIRFRRSIEAGHLDALGHHGDGVANLIYVDDLADMCATLALSDIPEFSILNANGFERATFNEYFNEIRSALGQARISQPQKRLARDALAMKLRRPARAALKLSAIVMKPILSRSKSAQALFETLSHALQKRPEDGAYSDYSSQTYYTTEAAQAFGLMANTSICDGVARCFRQPQATQS